MTDISLLAQFEPKPGATLDYERQLWEARFSPCNKFLIGGGHDAAIQRWDVSASPPRRLSPLTGHNGWVQCVAFHPDGERIFSADSWGELRCWPFAAEAPQPLWTQSEALAGWIRSLAVSPDGRLVATAGNDPAVRLWSCDDGTLQRELPEHPDDVFSVRFHPDGKSLATGDLKGIIRHWELASGKLVRQIDASALYKRNSLQDCGGARALAFDGGGGLLACGGQKSPAGGFAQGAPCVLLFDWESGRLKQEMVVGGNDEGFVYDLAFHPSGFLMTASSAFPNKGHVCFWRPGDEAPFFAGKKLVNGRSLSLTGDGKQLALLTAISPNGNGRSLKDGEYPCGTGKIHLLELGAA